MMEIQCDSSEIIEEVTENQSQFLDDDDDDTNKMLSTLLRALVIVEKRKQMKREGTDGGCKKCVLPYSNKDVDNTTPKKGPWRFIGFARWIVFSLSPEYHAALLSLCITFLAYQVRDSCTPFDFQHGNSPPHLLLSFREAFPAFLSEMAHITGFILCYFLTWALVLPLQLEVQVFLMLFLIYVPLLFFPALARKASGVDVDCGSFKLSLMLFTTLGAIVLSLICGLFTLLYLIFVGNTYTKEQPRVKEVKVTLDGIAEVWTG